MLPNPQSLRHSANLQHGANSSVRGGAGGVASEDRDLATAWRREAQQQLDGRSFAGSVGTEQRNQISGAHFKVEVHQRLNRAVVLVYAFDSSDGSLSRARRRILPSS